MSGIANCLLCRTASLQPNEVALVMLVCLKRHSTSDVIGGMCKEHQDQAHRSLLPMHREAFENYAGPYVHCATYCPYRKTHLTDAQEHECRTVFGCIGANCGLIALRAGVRREASQ